jgi:Flp pilus assembly protein TadG
MTGVRIRSIRLAALLRDSTGASMIEFAIVFPVLALVALGAVDLGYYFYQWNAVGKATHLGARLATVINPVAAGLNDLTVEWSKAIYSDKLGLPCSVNGTSTGNCPVNVTVTCVPNSSAGGTCTCAPAGGICSVVTGFNNVAFDQILQEMQRVYPQLTRTDVRISYRSTGLGFVGRPGGLPMTVGVSVPCRTHRFFFVEGLANLVAPTPTGACAGAPAGWPLPTSLATFTTEDMTGSPTT